MRAEMEDSDLILQNLWISDQFVSYYAIFDGHGGKVCSEFLKENLHIVLQRLLKETTNISQWPSIIIEGFLECDKMFNDKYNEISKIMGSAAIVCLLTGSYLVVANLGDSRAILSRRGEAIQLSNDHKPDLPSEKSKIERAGGVVSYGRVMGKLSLSRAFGDFEFKNYGNFIVSCNPEVEIYQINKNIDEFIIIGCDGLFEAYANQEVVKLIREKLKKMNVTEQNPSRVIKDVVNDAVYARRTGDNVSAILVTLSAGLI